jgi:hypothetical protein
VKHPAPLLITLSFSAGCYKVVKSATEPSIASTEAVVKRLVIPSIKDQHVQRGNRTNVPIKIERVNFNDPVALVFDNLPNEIKVETKQTVIPSNTDALFVVFVADPKAPIGEQSIFMTAQRAGT